MKLKGKVCKRLESVRSRKIFCSLHLGLKNSSPRAGIFGGVNHNGFHSKSNLREISDRTIDMVCFKDLITNGDVEAQKPI